MPLVYAINVVLIALSICAIASFFIGCGLGGYLLMTGNYTEESDHV